MKYMLMMHAPRGTDGAAGEYDVAGWTPADFEAHIGFMHAFNRGLREAGEWVDGHGLTPPAQATLVRAGADGRPVTDGPFAEAKEFLAGFWIVDVDGPERAHALAARISAAPGPGGVPLNMPVEVRQVMSAPPAPEA